jgi:hypothetical protein
MSRPKTTAVKDDGGKTEQRVHTHKTRTRIHTQHTHTTHEQTHRTHPHTEHTHRTRTHRTHTYTHIHTHKLHKQVCVCARAGPQAAAAAASAADDEKTECQEAADHPTDMLPSSLPAARAHAASNPSSSHPTLVPSRLGQTATGVCVYVCVRVLCVCCVCCVCVCVLQDRQFPLCAQTAIIRMCTDCTYALCACISASCCVLRLPSSACAQTAPMRFVCGNPLSAVCADCHHQLVHRLHLCALCVEIRFLLCAQIAIIRMCTDSTYSLCACISASCRVLRLPSSTCAQTAPMRFVCGNPLSAVCSDCHHPHVHRLHLCALCLNFCLLLCAQIATIRLCTDCNFVS